MKDGWHTVKGYEVYVYEGKVIRGKKYDFNGQELPSYPYKYLDDYNSYVNVSGQLSFSAFRSCLSRGTVKMF